MAALHHASYSLQCPAAETQLLHVAKSLPRTPAVAPSPKTRLVTLAYRVDRSPRAPLRLQVAQTTDYPYTVALRPVTDRTRASTP